MAFDSSTAVIFCPVGEILRISSSNYWIALSTWQLAFLLNASLGSWSVMPMEQRGLNILSAST